MPECTPCLCKKFNELKNSRRIADVLAAEILSEDNRLASDVLKLCGFHSFVPGTIFAPSDDVYEFYGVDAQHFRNFFSRFGFSNKVTPDDVLYMCVSDFVREFNPSKRLRYGLTISESGILTDTKTKYSKEFLKGFMRYTFLSARLILAFSAIMYYGRRIPAHSPVKAVFETVKDTSYFEIAEDIRKQNEQRMIYAGKDQNNDAADGCDSKELVEPMPDGRLSISPAIFSQIISDGIAQGMNGVQAVLYELAPLMRQINDKMENAGTKTR